MDRQRNADRIVKLIGDDLAGDKSLYRQFFRNAYRRLGNRDTTEEILAEFYLRIVERACQFREEVSALESSNLMPWFNTILRNLINSYYRDRARKGNKVDFFQEDGDEDYLNKFVVSKDISPVDSLIEEETRMTVRNSVTNLPKNWRELIMIDYYTGMSREDLAKYLCINHKVLNSRLFNARKGLARSVVLGKVVKV